LFYTPSVVVMRSLDCLFLSVNLGNHLGVVKLALDLLLSAVVRVNSSEIGRTVHLVGVELIWASVLILVVLSIYAIEEGISGLEAQLVIELVGVEVPHVVESVV
jgi:hypothetical protein